MTKLDYIMKLVNRPSAWVGHGVFAMDLVEALNPNTIVDLGVDYGFSTFCFAYHNIGNVYGVDAFKGDAHAGFRDTLETVLETYEMLKTKKDISPIEFIKGNFNQVSLTWDKPIDILHIDGFHTYEAVTNDFNSWSKFVAKDGVILFHDIESYSLTVGRFFEEREGYKLIKSGSAGLGILTQSEKTYNLVKKLI